MHSTSDMNQQVKQPFSDKPTYASKVKKIEPLTSFIFLTSEQGIIIPYVADSKIRDYLTEISDILSTPKHIIASSRISKNQVSVFLDSSQMVDTFLSRPTSIKILNQLIYGRHLKNKPKKVVSSNVPPTITNILDHGIKIETFIKNLATSSRSIR